MIKDKYKNIDNLIKDAYFTSDKAYKVLSRHLEDERYDSDRDELIAGILLNKAISLISAAKAVYFSNHEELEHSNIDKIFSTFDEFSDELLKNLSENHSHQWTDFGYNDFKDVIKNVYGI